MPQRRMFEKDPSTQDTRKTCVKYRGGQRNDCEDQSQLSGPMAHDAKGIDTSYKTERAQHAGLKSAIPSVASNGLEQKLKSKKVV
eukprot:3851250-Amphidinium_carterae.1